MAAHSGKGSANGSGANPALDTDAAEELAANFRPSWAADDDDDLPPGMAQTAPAAEPAPAPAAPGTAAVSIAPVVTISNNAPPVTSAAEAASAAAAAPPAPAPPQTQKMLSPQTVLGMGTPVRAPEPSSEALDSQNVIEVSPAPPTTTWVTRCVQNTRHSEKGTNPTIVSNVAKFLNFSLFGSGRIKRCCAAGAAKQMIAESAQRNVAMYTHLFAPSIL